MYQASLCILTCNQVDGVLRLLESFKAFDWLELEVVIGDNSKRLGAIDEFKALADRYLTVADRDLWYEGFGLCKGRIVRAAKNDLVIIADPDEEWAPVDYEDLLEDWQGSVFRTQLIVEGEAREQHGRVFDRRAWRLRGMIHEELYHNKTRVNWGEEATDSTFANVVHHANLASSAYNSRKKALYDNIIHRIADNAALAVGTNSYWLNDYYPRLLESGFSPMTFDAWSSMPQE